MGKKYLQNDPPRGWLQIMIVNVSVDRIPLVKNLGGLWGTRYALQNVLN